MNGSRTGSLGGSVQALEKRLSEIPNLTPDTKVSLEQGVREVKDQIDRLRVYEKDIWFYRIIVCTLGFSVLLIVIAITFLLFNKIDGFDALTAIGSAAIGGLVGLLAPSPIGSK